MGAIQMQIQVLTNVEVNDVVMSSHAARDHDTVLPSSHFLDFSWLGRALSSWSDDCMGRHGTYRWAVVAVSTFLMYSPVTMACL